MQNELLQYKKHTALATALPEKNELRIMNYEL